MMPGNFGPRWRFRFIYRGRFFIPKNYLSRSPNLPAVAEDYNDKNKPSYICAAYKDMEPAWQIMADTCAGTPQLRKAGKRYLPQEPAENNKHYEYRLDRAVFYNAVDLTLSALVGMVFRNDPKLAENVPEAIRGRAAEGDSAAVEGHWENIDNAGTDGVVFTKEVFSNAMRDGHAAILVDMPPALPEGSTLADEVGRRPYWVSYKANEIINWRTDVIDGKTTLVLIVFRECTSEPDGQYGQKEVTRYRVFRRGDDGKIVWELYEVRKQENGQMEPVFEDGGPISLPDIPVAFVYSRKLGILMSQPPLIDLAYLNIQHYQKDSDFSTFIHIGSHPILCRKGASQQPITAIGPYTIFDVSEQGDVWYAEPTGAAYEAASNDIAKREERMSILGLSLLVKRTGDQVTATEERGDQIEESSALATAARSLKHCIEAALEFHAQYLNAKAETGGNVDLGAALDAQELTPEEMTVWSNAVLAGQYRIETMWNVFEAGGKLPADFDPKVEKTGIEEAAKKKQESEIAMQDAISRNFDRGGAAEE